MKRLVLAACLLVPLAARHEAQMPGEQPALRGHRITQDEIVQGVFQLEKIRLHGLRIFSAQFNKVDGFGDGPMNHNDPMANGGRPTLNGNGTLLRVNGLDAQSCIECHSVLSARSIPMRFSAGGFGTANNNVLGGGTRLDPADTMGMGMASFNGRFINPPFVFGAGGIELLGKEMTADLQRLRDHALANPGLLVNLETKGISFGRLKANTEGDWEVHQIEGIEDDLVVRPFGRKGEFATTRAFDVGAMQFHHGMEPVEVVGDGVDGDGDGVVNELLVGEISALSVFNVTLAPPARRATPGSVAGEPIFNQVGCADCHTPFLDTNSPVLGLSYPEIERNPAENVFFSVDLSQAPVGFPSAPNGGVRVNLYSDLKRHDMGASLTEHTGDPLDRWFITPRLWGVGDSAPYMHDGRALTLAQAIVAHDGEARAARDAYLALSATEQFRLIRFLKSLRTPKERADRDMRVKDLEQLGN